MVHIFIYFLNTYKHYLFRKHRFYRRPMLEKKLPNLIGAVDSGQEGFDFLEA